MAKARFHPRGPGPGPNRKHVGQRRAPLVSPSIDIAPRCLGKQRSDELLRCSRRCPPGRGAATAGYYYARWPGVLLFVMIGREVGRLGPTAVCHRWTSGLVQRRMRLLRELSVL